MQRLASIIARYLLGLTFFIFGGAGLFNLIPPPPELPAGLQSFMQGILFAGYFLPFLKSTEMICGLLLLLGVAPALALLILATITIHIVLVHSFLTPGLQNLIVPGIILILHLVAAKGYWRVYRPLFDRNKV